jgi:hypothetical protein
MNERKPVHEFMKTVQNHLPDLGDDEWQMLSEQAHDLFNKGLKQRPDTRPHKTVVMRSDDAKYMTTSTPVNIYWKPKKDITAYELAKAMDILLYMVSGGDTWTAERLIGEASGDVKRHFDIKPNA